MTSKKEWLDGNEYGEWDSYVNGDAESLQVAISRVSELLVKMMTAEGRAPDTLEWIVKTDKSDGAFFGPLGYRPGRDRHPDHDASIGWKAYYKAVPGAR